MWSAKRPDPLAPSFDGFGLAQAFLREHAEDLADTIQDVRVDSGRIDRNAPQQLGIVPLERLHRAIGEGREQLLVVRRETGQELRSNERAQAPGKTCVGWPGRRFGFSHSGVPGGWLLLRVASRCRKAATTS